MQVKVSLSLRIGWIASANPPYEYSVQIKPPYGRKVKKYTRTIEVIKLMSS